MKVLIRLVAVLTVLMSMALMAVSVYAAKTEPVVARASWAGETAPGQPTPFADNHGSLEAPTPRLVSDIQIKPSKTTRASLRFAAPDDAAQVGVTATGVSSLSTAVRVWSVPSFRSGLFGEGASSGADIPPDQLKAMRQIGAAFGLPWQVLAGIAKVESDFGNNMATSSAGAIGYGQFLPEAWEIYGAGGDPYNYRDALLAMTRYLIAAGAPADIPEAIYAYNHSWPYVEAVLSYAATLGLSSATNGANFIWPVLGPISSYFGPSHPLGIDIDQTASPNAPVWAAHAGVIVFAGGDPCCSYGNYVIVQGAAGIATLYAHLDTIAVRQGQIVQQQEVLGTVGCTGHCTGLHLHFEVIEDGVRRNPLDYLPGGA